ncbi:MAG: zf-HC2 domain-containing protein [Porphyromonadaceae bacterium]|nr:MAG: zf-HC2 domain-containing protein [Porphyromonadaceae bacterium]
MITNIKCRNIAGFLYLTDDEMDSQEALLLFKHLASCSPCKKSREDFLATRRVTLQLMKDIPIYPDFTASTEILIKSGKTSTKTKPEKPFNPFWNNTLSIIRFASTIAAVFLLFLFVWEQTISVRKISMLENRIQSIIIPSEPGLIDRITLARSVFTVKEWNDLAVSMNVNQTVSDPHDILRIKILLEKRFRSGKTNELALINSLRNSWIIKRNETTFKNLIK